MGLDLENPRNLTPWPGTALEDGLPQSGGPRNPPSKRPIKNKACACEEPQPRSPVLLQELRPKLQSLLELLGSRPRVEGQSGWGAARQYAPFSALGPSDTCCPLSPQLHSRFEAAGSPTLWRMHFYFSGRNVTFNVRFGSFGGSAVVAETLQM